MPNSALQRDAHAHAAEWQSLGPYTCAFGC